MVKTTRLKNVMGWCFICLVSDYECYLPSVCRPLMITVFLVGGCTTKSVYWLMTFLPKKNIMIILRSTLIIESLPSWTGNHWFESWVTLHAISSQSQREHNWPCSLWVGRWWAFPKSLLMWYWSAQVSVSCRSSNFLWVRWLPSNAASTAVQKKEVA